MGKSVEDARVVMLTARVAKPLADEVGSWAVERGVPRSEAVRLLLQAGLRADAVPVIAHGPKSLIAEIQHVKPPSKKATKKSALRAATCMHPVTSRMRGTNYCFDCGTTVK